MRVSFHIHRGRWKEFVKKNPHPTWQKIRNGYRIGDFSHLARHRAEVPGEMKPSRIGKGI